MSLIYYFVFIYALVPSFRAFVNNALTAGPKTRYVTPMGQNTKIFLWLGALLVVTFMTITTVYSDEIQAADEKLALMKHFEEMKQKSLKEKCNADVYISPYDECYDYFVRD